MWGSGIHGPATTFLGLPAIPREQEIAILEEQRKYIEEELSQINKRLEELKTEGGQPD